MLQILVYLLTVLTFLYFQGFAVCSASKYVSFSLVFALIGKLQGKVFRIQFSLFARSPQSLSTQRVSDSLARHSKAVYTMGMRIVEQLKMDWLADSLGKKTDNPIEVASLPAILADIKKQGTKYGSAIVHI